MAGVRIVDGASEDEFFSDSLAWGGPPEPSVIRKAVELSECFCNIHKKPQIGVGEGLGCWTKGVGLHDAVAAAAVGAYHVCSASESTRKVDAEFQELVQNLGPGFELGFKVDRLSDAVMRFGTSSVDMKAFQRSYCHFVAIYQPFYMRMARVFGPNPFIMDVMKMMCVAGRKRMKPVVVECIQPGFYHFRVDKKFKGQVDDGGVQLYGKLVEIVKGCPEARVG
jgi:hypothetical protein